MARADEAVGQAREQSAAEKATLGKIRAVAVAVDVTALVMPTRAIGFQPRGSRVKTASSADPSSEPGPAPPGLPGEAAFDDAVPV